MKVLVLTFVTAIVTSSGAFAFGPFMPLTIATITSEDGSKIDISSAGDVVRTEQGKAPHLLQTLSRASLERFNTDQDGLSIKGNLQPIAGDAPICADMQKTTYAVRGRNGKLQLIGSIDGCHDFVPSDDSAQAISLRLVLKSLGAKATSVAVAKK